MTIQRYAEWQIAFGLGMVFAFFLNDFVRPWLDRRRRARKGA